jgi:neurofibromin 1
METDGLVIPRNNANFITRISECLAENEPRLTLDFLGECIRGLESSSLAQKQLCLEYMAPWLPNVKVSDFVLFRIQTRNLVLGMTAEFRD